MSAPVSRPDHIYGILKYRILTCALRPGERLVEKPLTEELQTSRTPLREALNRLAQEDLVILTPYRGYAVSPLTVKDIRELCELRLILESEAPPEPLNGPPKATSPSWKRRWNCFILPATETPMTST